MTENASRCSQMVRSVCMNNMMWSAQGTAGQRALRSRWITAEFRDAFNMAIHKAGRDIMTLVYSCASVLLCLTRACAH